MFGVHTEIVSEPFIDALREMNGYSSSSADPVPVYLRALLSSDGGLTQLKSITSDASLNRKVKRNETQLTIGTNSRGSVFQRLGYGVDTDADGNEHLIPDSYAQEIHRQRCMDLTHPKVMENLVTSRADALSVRERFRKDHLEEMRWRQKELESNVAIEADLHANTGCPRRVKDEPDIHMEFLASKRGKVIPFVNARKMQSKTDKSFKQPSHVGKIADLRAAVAKLNRGVPIAAQLFCSHLSR
jgi:hypothetical protein